MLTKFIKLIPMHTKILTFIIFCTLVIYSCAAPKKVSTPAEAPKEVDTYVAPAIYSNININYKISKKAIQDTFQFIIDDIFKQEMIMPDYEVRTKLKRISPMSVEFTGKNVLVVLPLDVEVSKKTFLKDFKANGTLELTFTSAINIAPNWAFTTKTAMSSHKWIKKPKLDIGIINIPIETISDFVLQKTKVEIEKSIDLSMKEQFDLPLIINDMSKELLSPVQLPPAMGGWMQMQADSAYMSPVRNETFYTSGKIGVRTKMLLSSAGPEPSQNKILAPTFNWKENISDSSTLRLGTELTYSHLTQVAKTNFVGQTFADGDKKITVQDISIGKRDGKLDVTVKVAGSFNGTLSVRGVPAYNKTTKTLYANNIDISVKSGNIFTNAAAWLLEGRIRKELDKTLQINIADQLTNVQNQVNLYVSDYNKTYKTKVKVDVGNLGIDHIFVRPDRMNVFISVKAKISSTLDNLFIFQE
jgi:peroxiredoxin